MNAGVIGAGQGAVVRRMRRRRIVRLALLIVFAAVWIPVAIIMVVAGVSDRRV